MRKSFIFLHQRLALGRGASATAPSTFSFGFLLRYLQIDPTSILYLLLLLKLLDSIRYYFRLFGSFGESFEFLNAKGLAIGHFFFNHNIVALNHLFTWRLVGYWSVYSDILLIFLELTNLRITG